MVSRLAWAFLAVFALVTGVDIAVTPMPPRSTVVDILVEAARTGTDVSAVVASRGIAKRAWGRALLLHGRDRSLTVDVTRRLCEGTRR
jgi:hypothetical protein